MKLAALVFVLSGSEKDCTLLESSRLAEGVFIEDLM